MEYLSFIESLDEEPKLNSSYSYVREEDDDCLVTEDSCGGLLPNIDAYSISSSSDEEIHGFDTPKKDKHHYILNLMKKIEAKPNEEPEIEKDVIDGIEFLSFSSEQELMDYAKAQQDLRANASQSDDGLEIFDDGTFSDISSNHAIVPTKTKDITRIKGWRNKHFVGINVCDDSGSSLRNDDDGFGDDFEMKSIQDESSEELESVDYAASTTSKSGFEGDTSHENNIKRIDSPVIEDTNAVDIAEGFPFQKSRKNLSSSSLSSCMSQKSIASNSSKNNTIDFSFDNFDIMGIFTSDKMLNISAISDPVSSKKSVDSFISPLAPQDRKTKYCQVYKPRVKKDFLESIARKVNAENHFPEENIESLLSNNKVDRGIRWRVPKDKLLSGNIYDVEVSISPDPKMSACETSDVGEITENCNPNSGLKKSLSKEGESLMPCTKLIGEDVAAFRSTTLENYTTYLDKLHIDFTIPKLDAADNVTHEEILLPVQDSLTSSNQRQKPKPIDKVRAKTVAEKRRLLTKLSINERSRRKQKLSFKLRANNEIVISKRPKRLKVRTEKNAQSENLNDELKPIDKKSQSSKPLFDGQGVITYGREKPLNSAISKSVLAYHNPSLSCNMESLESSPSSSKVGMILNIGVNRPIYREADDILKKFAFDDNDNITAPYAAFASSAVQDSFQSTFTVKRILVPAEDNNLKRIMFSSKKRREIVKRTNLKNTPRITKNKIKVYCDSNLNKNALELSGKTKLFVKNNHIDNDVSNIVYDLLNYVVLKERFQNIHYSYDPDIPIPIEKEIIELNALKSTSSKKKKTKLQRQIEILGGTFIAVQGEEGNEENLAQISEEKKNCFKESCKMGCVCYYRMARDEHCGRESCMFFCQCPPFARRQGCEIKSKIWLLPEVLRHHNVSQSKLAPVEREYHQTVIMSKDKKITIETKHDRKRERKLPKKYKDEILFDFRKGNDHDNDAENDDCLLVSVEDEKISKQKRQESRETLDNLKKRMSTPMASTLATTLKIQTIVNDPKLNIKQCYVRIEKNETIDQKVAETTFIPGIQINSLKYSKFFKKIKNSKGSRNVAKKKTGSSTSHDFDVENFCSRTHGVTEDYVLRNSLGKMRTKDFLLYVSMAHGDNNSVLRAFNEAPLVKEDLVEMSSSDTEDESNRHIEEKNPNEEESGLEISFVRSLPPHLFEKQDQVDQEDVAVESNENTVGDSVELLKHVSSNSMEIENNILGREENKRFVYASLPKTENESKWWVVELDEEKFTDLVYYSEKRSLSYPLIKKAIFYAEYNNCTVKLALKNDGSPFEDKFGAYVVGGHKHLIFFGPYDLSENHGITAIRYENEKFIQVPFTTKFSKSKNFESLGIKMAPNIENSQSILRLVKAVWWYTTGKTGTLKTIAASRSAQEKQISSCFAVSHDVTRSSNGSEKGPATDLQSIDTDLHETVGVIEDVITIEHDPLKMEPFVYDEDSLYIDSVVENRKNEHTANTGIKCYADIYQTKSQQNTITPEKETNTGIDKTNPDDTTSSSQCTLLTTNRSVLKKNVAKMNITADKSPSPPKKEKLIIRKKRKRKSLFTKQKKREGYSTKKDMHITSLQEKIENIQKKALNLEEAILSQKVGTNTESLSLENVSEINFESDSSSLSDEDVLRDILPKQSHGKISNVKRVVHTGPKVAPKCKELTPGNLPKSLLQTRPRGGPCPEKALLCLTPGIGYLPVLEFDPRNGTIVIQDPCNPQVEHEFHNKSLAAEWLNQYFFDRFIFRPKFDMQWVVMTGSIIRMLQPLNMNIFKYKARAVTIRPCGVDPQIPVEQDLLDWERRELSLLKRKAGTPINKNHNIKKMVQAGRFEDRYRLWNDASEYGDKKRAANHNDLEYGVKKRAANHNDLERMRRSELAELFAELSKVVFPDDMSSRIPKISVLSRAKYVCEGQKMIEEKLSLKTTELKKKRETLNKKLKSLFIDTVNHEEKKKALDLCTFIRCYQYKLPDKNETYLKMMREKENKLVAKLSGLKRFHAPHIGPASVMSSSSSSCSLGSTKSGDINITEPMDTVRVSGGKQPTEGVFCKSKLQSLATSRPDLQISASMDGEVINLVDSEDENQIIEIESEEEDVIWLPAQDQMQEEDEDIQIVSSNFKRRRQKLKFPKPKRKPKTPTPQRPLFVSMGTTPDDGVLQETVTPVLTTSSERCSSDPSTPPPAPVAMVLSPALMEQHQLLAERAKTQTRTPGPEFVSVAEHDYEAVYCEFKSGCSRTDPVTIKRQPNNNPAQQQFIPIQQTSVINCINTLPLDEPAKAPLILKRNLTTPFANLRPIKLKSLGRIDKSSLKGKQVLLRKSIDGIRISKFPAKSTSLSHVTPLSATPVTITEALGNVNTSGGANAVESVSPDRANTVTLYHPSQEISVTKTVQFTNLNTVQIEMPTSSMLSGPKIRKPKDDSSPGGIKILLPKRT